MVIGAFQKTPPVPASCYEVLERRRSLTKVVRSETGYAWARYTGIPKLPVPRHRMVNDINQDLCGGWFRFLGYEDGLTLDSAVTAHRLLNGLKPAGSLDGPEWAVEEWEQTFRRRGFWVGEETYFGGEPGGRSIAVALSGTFDEVFGAKYVAAVTDYYSRGGRGVCVAASDLEAFRRPDWKLSDLFACDWANGDPSLAVVGLTLGYPVENTAALYRRDWS
jgi:hypothetical protein